jgi:HTH-type transcriptional regulator/antitoxin HipB
MADTYPVQFPAQLRQHLRALRKRRGLTQANVAALIGVSQARIAEIEANPGLVSLDQLMRVLSALDATVIIHDAVRNIENNNLKRSAIAAKNAPLKPRKVNDANISSTLENDFSFLESLEESGERTEWDDEAGLNNSPKDERTVSGNDRILPDAHHLIVRNANLKSLNKSRESELTLNSARKINDKKFELTEKNKNSYIDQKYTGKNEIHSLNAMQSASDYPKELNQLEKALKANSALNDPSKVFDSIKKLDQLRKVLEENTNLKAKYDSFISTDSLNQMKKAVEANSELISTRKALESLGSLAQVRKALEENMHINATHSALDSASGTNQIKKALEANSELNSTRKALKSLESLDQVRKALEENSNLSSVRKALNSLSQLEQVKQYLKDAELFKSYQNSFIHSKKGNW